MYNLVYNVHITMVKFLLESIKYIFNHAFNYMPKFRDLFLKFYNVNL